MLLEAAESTATQGGNVTSFILVILIWILIFAIICFVLIKKVIKPILSYFKTKQEYYAAQTEHLKNVKDKG